MRHQHRRRTGLAVEESTARDRRTTGAIMRAQPVAASQSRRIVAGLPFVEALARRMAASMPNSIEIGDLVQDGVLGLIDAARRFDEGRGIKFETFAERR